MDNIKPLVMAINRFILSSIFCLTIYSCILPPKDLPKEQSEIVYSHSVPFRKQELKLKIFSFIAENYVSAKAVIQFDEEGLICGNVIAPINTRTSMEYSFLLKYQDNTYKVKCILKRIFEDEIDIDKSMYGYYADKIQKEFKSFDSDLFQALSKNSENF